MKTFFIALLWAFVWSMMVLLYQSKNENPFLEYYSVENAVAVSPHDLRMEMDAWSKDTIVVDLRSAQEYSKEHIIWAINIPGFSPSDKDAKAQKERIISEFRKLPRNKRIVVHCYTHYCMLAKHVWLMLAQAWIYVHELNIGWNEWRYEWDLWNWKWTNETVDISRYLEWTEVKTWTGATGSILPDFSPCTKDGLAWC